jgi:hypothetical protein
VTRLRLPETFHEEMPAGDYEVLYVRPAAGLIHAVINIPIDEIGGWRCSPCRGARG